MNASTDASRRTSSSRGRLAGAKATSESHGAPGQAEPDHAAGDREQHALGEEVAGETRGCRAERLAHGHLTLPCIGADEKEVRDVRARHEQHEPDRCQQDPQRASNWPTTASCSGSRSRPTHADSETRARGPR